MQSNKMKKAVSILKPLLHIFNMGGNRRVQQAKAELHKLTVKTFLKKKSKQLSQPSPTNLFLTKE